MLAKNIVSRALLTCTMAGGLLIAGGTTPIRAANNGDQACQDRVTKAQAEVDKDAAKHGQGSHQVRDDLKKLDTEREWCAKHHADWDHARDKEYDNYRNIQQH